LLPARTARSSKSCGREPGPLRIRLAGLASLPDFTRARKEVKCLTGESFVPVLVLDDGEVIAGSDRIVAWASAR